MSHRPLLRMMAAIGLLVANAPVTPAETPVTAMAVSSDGSTLAVGRSGSVELVQPDRSGSGARLAVSLPKVNALAFHPDGKHLWIAGGVPGESGAVLELLLPEGTESRRFPVPSDAVQSLALSPDGRSLAHAAGSEVRRIELADSRRAVSLAGNSGRVLGLAFSPDPTWLVSIGADRAVKVWSTSSNTLARSFGHHTEAPNAIAFRPGAAVPTCATGGDDRTVRVWQPGIGRMVRIIRQHPGSILTLAYSADGQTLFTAGSEGIVRAFDADSDTLIRSWNASKDWIYTIAVHPGGQWIATGDWSGGVEFWRNDGSMMHQAGER